MESGLDAPGPSPPPARPLVVNLRDADAADPRVAGAKAANLARSMQAGLSVLPGFVITTAGAARGADDSAVNEALRLAWAALRVEHDGPVIVRSSSTVEDVAESSMAGQFTSVLDVDDWTSLGVAVERVLESAGRAAGGGPPQPMAVLVQAQLDVRVGGVMFGIDPVTGDRHHVVVDAVAARVDELVSGRVTAAHYVLSRRGRVLEVVHADVAPRLGRSERRRLVRLARTTHHLFGAAQDVEWAIDHSDRLWMLQSRPVTAIDRPRSTVLFGPGPVAETFPLPLRALEVDLWVVPLREAIRRAMTSTRAVSRRQLARSPLLVTVGGFAAVDLALLGFVRARRSRWRLLDPRPGARRLLASWRVGRLRVALPELTAQVVVAVDDDLRAIGGLDARRDDELLALVDAARRELATTHTLEILAGMLQRDDETSPSLAAVALAAVASARAEGLTDAEILARRPEVLALVPPTVNGTPPLPPTPQLATDTMGVEALGGRDALRLRTRWLQELLARIARELAGRLERRGALAHAVAARDCTIAELAGMFRGGAAPVDLRARAAVRPGAPLPAVFCISSHGDVIPRENGRPGDGIPAGGGRGIGVVRHSVDGPGAAGDTVLVVTNLEPQFAGALPGLAGLVAETGSPLSHLAILARETHVPTVVAVPGARQRFPEGTRVVVDGTTGVVTEVEPEPAS
jgi:pyruvate,water dikinase